MKVKKAGKRVFGAVMSAAEKKAMDMEIQRQLAEYDRKHIREIDALVLWELREQLGFGNKRLKKFYDNFSRGMDLVEEDILMHYGVKRRSGRYPWGSGDNPYQHGGDFLARVEELQRLGKTEKQIADELHLSTTDLRMQVRVAKHERRALQADRARSLREDGKTLDEIASILGYANDSSVRALLNENTAANKNKAQATAEILKKELAEKGAIDVGTGVERQLGVSTGVLQEALFILETEGYNRYGVGVPQVNDPKKRTITPVISVPEIDQREVYQNLDLVKSVGDYHSTDGGESWDKREYPASIDSSRVKILYGDEGGALKDGVIEIRRGVADLDLGDSHYHDQTQREEVARMAKAARSSEKVPKSRAALTPEAREKQLIALAIDVAEEQMRNGTASSQVISHFLKLGSTRAQIEKELLEKQRDLAAAKAEAIESSAKMEDLYLKAAKAMKSYQGQEDEEDEY